VEEGKKREYIKLHLFPPRSRELEKILTAELGPPAPGSWFFSNKYNSYVIPLDFGPNLREILCRLFGGKFLYTKGNIWTVLDQPFQDAVPLVLSDVEE